jgi:hydrogenase maturation protein HypF
VAPVTIDKTGERIRIRGLVQGVGFRPTVWRLARELDLRGDVRNDGEGVLIRVWGEAPEIDELCRRLIAECPPLGRIDAVERSPIESTPELNEFRIISSAATAVHTGIVADAATCAACLAEIRDPADRRYRYPFTNCTHCGPRLSIVRSIPYDRTNTSMAAFPMCDLCRREYLNPVDRRFHAQPNACPACGPGVWLENAEGERLDASELGAEDAIDAASWLLAQGRILAIKGIGGFHLACDACNEGAVGELRRRKGRYDKPFALMARDLEVVCRYCRIGDRETDLLASPAAPILLLDIVGPEGVAPTVAPGQSTLGFMLAYSPLHHLLLQDWDRPLVMTSGNRSEEPQCIDNGDARKRLAGLADFFLLHNRDISSRVDDSVIRVMDGAPRLLRRGRGYAPAPVRLPEGLEGPPPVLALGGELKNSICLLSGDGAILSQHLGDLEEARTAAEYAGTIGLYRDLFQHDPQVLAVDLHPDYRSSRLGRDWAVREGLDLVEVQHHFAHIAAVLADNGWPVDGGPVVGIALDGLGYGADGTIWGGELLVADYSGYELAGHLKPVPLPGGTKAILEPWRNVYAHLATHFGWEEIRRHYRYLDLIRDLARKPLDALTVMMERGINSPLSSSCGRLFDSVAAAVGICRDSVTYEGQAAVELETLAASALGTCRDGYPFEVAPGDVPLVLDPEPMWIALLDDLARGEEPASISARFHAGLAGAVAQLAIRLAQNRGIGTVALSGGVFQNKILLEGIADRLRSVGLRVLSHRQVPANDGGISLGQAAIAAARAIRRNLQEV